MIAGLVFPFFPAWLTFMDILHQAGAGKNCCHRYLPHLYPYHHHRGGWMRRYPVRQRPQGRIFSALASGGRLVDGDRPVPYPTRPAGEITSPTFSL